jgi:hypothetical protein
VFDVAYFLALNFEPDARSAQERQIVDAYTAALAERGVSYPRDACFADYRRALLYFMPRLVCAGGLAEFAHEKASREYLRMLTRALSAVEDHGSLALNR